MLLKHLRKDQKKVKNKRKVKRSSKQKRKYSGKKKRHMHKIQMVIDANTKQIICVHFGNGATHDFKLYKKTNLKIHPNIKQKVDKGYLGANKIHKNTQIPHKKSKNHPLSKEQKRENKELARERISVEHKNGELKVFKLVEHRYRSHSRFGLRITLICSFINANRNTI